MPEPQARDRNLQILNPGEEVDIGNLAAGTHHLNGSLKGVAIAAGDDDTVHALFVSQSLDLLGRYRHRGS